jgi:DNA polymerase-3 subunit gamma/tau
MLGAIDQTYLFALVEAVAAGDAAAAVKIADDMQARSLSFDAALADLAALLLKLALAHTVPDALSDDPERARLAELASRVDAESVQLYYQIALQAREDLPLAPDEHGGFVMTLLRMLAFRPEAASSELPSPRKTPAASDAPGKKAAAGASQWPQLVRELAVTGAARELARNAELQRQENGVYELVVPKAKAYLADRAYVDKLKAALDLHLGAAVRVNVSVGEVAGASAAALEVTEREAKRAEAVKSVQGDGFVQDLVNIFDARVVDSSIREREK